MKSSPSPRHRRAARFVSTWALVLRLGLAAIVAGCGAGEGTNEGPDKPEDRKLIEDAKRQGYKQEKANANAARRGGSAEGVHRAPR